MTSVICHPIDYLEIRVLIKLVIIIFDIVAPARNTADVHYLLLFLFALLNLWPSAFLNEYWLHQPSIVVRVFFCTQWRVAACRYGVG